MNYIGIIAAGGAGRRTGLSVYTSKAALRVGGKSLFEHNIAFLRRSGVDRIVIVCPVQHVRLLASLLSDEDRALVAFVLLPAAGTLGWAGTIECARAYVADEDEVLLISCDNYHTVEKAVRLDRVRAAIFTYTRREQGSTAVTDGPVLGHVDHWVWQQTQPNFVGDVFTGYAAVRGRALLDALRSLPLSDRGEKEFTALLEVFWTWFPRVAAIPYGGEYIDVADLRALAQLDVRVGDDHLGPPISGDISVGAGVLLHDNGRVFLTERQDGFGWVPPGGLVDGGESYVHAAARELREEVGIEVTEDSLRLLGVYPAVGKHGGPACSVIFHREMYASPRVDVREVRDAGWFSAGEAAKKVIPFGLRDSVDDFFAGRELDCRVGAMPDDIAT